VLLSSKATTGAVRESAVDGTHRARSVALDAGFKLSRAEIPSGSRGVYASAVWVLGRRRRGV